MLVNDPVRSMYSTRPPPPPHLQRLVQTRAQQAVKKVRNIVCTLPENSVVFGVPDLVHVRGVAFSRSKGPAIGLPGWEMTRPREQILKYTSMFQQPKSSNRSKYSHLLQCGNQPKCQTGPNHQIYVKFKLA